MKRIVKTIVLLALTVSLALGCTGAALAEASVGSVCPDFSLTTLSGGTFRLSDYRGKVVFINIWATWCPPCVYEMPDIQRLQDTYPNDLVVLGVSVDDYASQARAFIQENGYTYTMAMEDDYGTVSWRIFPTNAIPHTIFVDPNGVVTYIRSGSMSYQSMESLYLAAKANAKPTTPPTTPEPVPPRTPGDANEDGEVDIVDAMLVLRATCGWDVDISLANSEVNGDGEVDIADAMLILRYTCGWNIQLQ